MPLVGVLLKELKQDIKKQKENIPTMKKALSFVTSQKKSRSEILRSFQLGESPRFYFELLLWHQDPKLEVAADIELLRSY